MSEVSGIGIFGSAATASVLSTKEQQYFKRVFGATGGGQEATAALPQTESAPLKPHIGTRLNVKV